MLSPVPGPISMIIFLLFLKNWSSIFCVLINFFKFFFFQVKDFLIVNDRKIIFVLLSYFFK